VGGKSGINSGGPNSATTNKGIVQIA
jgi:hypothetical protein